ncbi:hypothetical protein CU097_000999, partial [Rhizopus azygosporus]
MIDCSSTETGAIRDVFEDSVQVLLCHWHIWRAWDSKLKAVTLKCLYGFQTVKLSSCDMKKKKLACAFDKDAATSMAQRSEEEDDMYDYKPFTDDYIWYEAKLKNDHLFRCNCPDGSKLCKHIFLVNRVTNVPYTLRSDVVVETDTTGLNHEELVVTGINFADTTNNSTSDNDLCQELADSID